MRKRLPAPSTTRRLAPERRAFTAGLEIVRPAQLVRGLVVVHFRVGYPGRDTAQVARLAWRVADPCRFGILRSKIPDRRCRRNKGDRHGG